MTIHRHFEDQLNELKWRLIAMGTAAESMIERAVKSLLERDAGRHPGVFKTEQEVKEANGACPRRRGRSDVLCR